MSTINLNVILMSLVIKLDDKRKWRQKIDCSSYNLSHMDIFNIRATEKHQMQIMEII